MSPRTAWLLGLRMPAFSLATRSRHPGDEVGVIAPDRGDHGDVAVDDVGGVVPTEQADLDDRDVDRRVRRMPPEPRA